MKIKAAPWGLDSIGVGGPWIAHTHRNEKLMSCC